MAQLVDHWQVTADGWEDGVARLSWLITLPGLADVAAGVQPELASHSWLDPVDPCWLHLTVAEAEPPRIGRPFLLRFDGLELWPTGAMLVPRPCDELAALGIERPHVSLAYVNDGCEVDPDAVLPHVEPCETLVERVERVWLRRHARSYTWTAA